MTVEFDDLWDYAQPEATAVKFRALLPEAESSGDVSYLSQLLTQIARTQSLQGNFDDANAILDRVDSLLTDDLLVSRIRSSLERGRTLNSSGHPEESVQFFLDAWNLAQEQGEDFHAIDAAHMLGIVEPPEKQMAWSELALKSAEASHQPRARVWLGPIYNNLAWTYHDLGRYEDALDMFRRSFAWREAQGQQRESRIAAWSVARCLRSLGRIEEALELQTENLVATDEAGEPAGEIEAEIGECLLALGRSSEAHQHFRRAHLALLRDTWVVEHQPERLERFKTLARS